MFEIFGVFFRVEIFTSVFSILFVGAEESVFAVYFALRDFHIANLSQFFGLISRIFGHRQNIFQYHSKPFKTAIRVCVQTRKCCKILSCNT